LIGNPSLGLKAPSANLRIVARFCPFSLIKKAVSPVPLGFRDRLAAFGSLYLSNEPVLKTTRGIVQNLIPLALMHAYLAPKLQHPFFPPESAAFLTYYHTLIQNLKTPTHAFVRPKVGSRQLWTCDTLRLPSPWSRERQNIRL
jgi:hypothetical protein